MDSIGDPWDNALAETFFASLSKELLPRERFAPREQARLRIFWYIECFYNPRHRRSSLACSARSTSNSDTNRRPSRPNEKVSTETGYFHASIPPHVRRGASRPERESADVRCACREPSDGLEPSTPSLPCGLGPLPWVAGGCAMACLSRFRAWCICQRLPLVAPAGLHKCSTIVCSARRRLALRLDGITVLLYNT